MAHPHAIFAVQHPTTKYKLAIIFDDDAEHQTQAAVRSTFDPNGEGTVEKDGWWGWGSHMLIFQRYTASFSKILTLAVSGGYSIQPIDRRSAICFLLTKNNV